MQVAFSLAFSILLFHNFFKELPKELIDAARMDNCGYLRIYWYITLPLSLPIIATVGVFDFVGSWNSFLLAADRAQHRRQLHLAAGHHAVPGRSMVRTGRTSWPT